MAPVTAGLLAVALFATSATAAPATPVFRLRDERIDEASGIGVGIRSPDVAYVQNDSGDTARFFAVDRTSGATRGVYEVGGATNVDWEDLAVARDAAGTPSVWLADIGDNDAARDSVQLYRVAEPQVTGGPVPMDALAPTVQVPLTGRWNLRYPDGAHDAETLIVDDHGRAFVVTKSLLGSSGVYSVPVTPSATVQTMTKVGAVRFRPTSTPGPFGVVGHLTATGGAFGNGVVVIRTYTDAYVWNATGGVVAALRSDPVRLPLPEQRQGEGVCIVDGDRLLIDSEGVGSPVFAVPFTVPGHLVPSPSASPGTADASAMPRTSQPVVISRDGRSSGTVVLLVLLAAGVAFFAIGFAGVGLVLVLRRRRRV